ncbi:MAG: Crp/Fnr family transcriptional regulator [Cyclobacteriaceae bacterium]
MKKKLRMPAFLMDYSSVWNPLMMAFLADIIQEDDNDHGLKLSPTLGLRIQNVTPMIDKEILIKYGGKAVMLKKNEILFNSGTSALYYYQLQEGSVKMITNSEDGQEFIQGIFSPGDSFGEPPLFCGFSYPSTAIAVEDSQVIRLSKDNFFNLLKENFEIHLKFDQVLCNRLKYKSMILSDISFHDPEHRIMSLLKHLKGNAVTSETGKGMIRSTKPFVIPFTRQQLADMSGLRVETVIRTVKKMQEKGKLEIIGRKITI